MKEFLIKLITAHSGISSKRVCGIIGFFVIIFIVLCGELAGILVYGFYVGDSYISILNQIPRDRIVFNSVSYEMLLLKGLPYISKGTTLLCKYNIDGLGMVFRWSKLSRKIDEMYKIAWENKLKNV